MPETIGRVIQAFKSITTHQYIMGVREKGWRPFHARLWQRNYYEHVIRDGGEMSRVREYITSNPVKWDNDPENRMAWNIDTRAPWM